MEYKTRQPGPGCVKPGDTCYLPFMGRRVPVTVMTVDSMGMVHWPKKREQIPGQTSHRELKPGYLGFNDFPLPLDVRTREGINLKLVPPSAKDISRTVNPN